VPPEECDDEDDHERKPDVLDVDELTRALGAS